MRICRHELRILVGEGSVALVSLLFAIFMGYAVANGATWARARAERVRQIDAEAAAGLAKGRQDVVDVEQGRKKASDAPFAGWLFTISLPAALPPLPLTLLSIGQADLYPFATTIEINSSKDSLFTNYETDNPTTLLAGRFDPAFVIVYLSPLLICALTYNLLAQEREEGTLALTLAQPVRLRTVAIAKVAVRLALVVTLIGGSTLIGLALAGADLGAGDTAARVAWSQLLILAYALFWFALATWVDARGRRPAANATLLAAVWLVLVVVAPSLLSLTVSSLHPVPSRLRFVEETRRLDNELGRLGERVLAQYHGDHPELAPPGTLDWTDLQSRFYVIRNVRERRVLPLVRTHQEQLARQQRLVDRLRFISPAVLMQEAMNTSAGTDRGRFEAFQRQVEAFIDGWRLYAVPRSFRRISLRSSDYDDLPRFEFREPPNGRVLWSVLTATSGLLVAAAIIGWLALRRLRRYPLVG